LPNPSFFLDHNVAEQVAQYLEEEGFETIRLKDVLVEDSADPVVATHCIETGQVLITHDNDFKTMRRRLLASGRRFRTLHVILLSCPNARARDRLAFTLPAILAVWQQIEGQTHHPLKVQVFVNGFKVLEE
jgi:predicted nuclease of predicted toxin-antitoxin system